MKNKITKDKKKIKVRYDRILILLLPVFLIIGVFVFLFSIKITNIYVINNSILKDQEIIEQAGISDYPSTLKNSALAIENSLKKNVLIKNVKVYKKDFTKVYIEIEENEPLFYYENEGKTVLSDGRTTDMKFSVPTVINYIEDNLYGDFIKQMATLDKSVLNMISEIKFSPLVEGDDLFLLTMSDGNYVYVDLYADLEDDIAPFELLNMYLTFKEDLPNKNGILNLDRGNNFEIIE